LETLIPVRRRFLDDHHVCGRANDDALTVPVCRNCHAILTEGQRTAGLDFGTPPTLLHQLAAILVGLFTFLHDLSTRGLIWIDGLRAFIAALDRNYPAWRQMPEARAIGVRS
jgi:hypothetical protein